MNGLRTKTSWLRGPITRGVAGRIEREGGDNGAGLIRQLAVVTRGEAKGHDLWLDRFFVRSVHDAIGEQSSGVKSRFTHPGLSGDGLARFLGRVRNPRMAQGGDVVRGDLHFAETSHRTPDGDLAAYVMDLAEQDPKAFGASIVFQHDLDAEDELVTKMGGKSGDRRNTENLRHARMKTGSLRAVDAVDEPASNPDGLFHARDVVAAQAEELVSFALGLTDDLSGEHFDTFDVHPDRIRRFVADFLDRNGCEIIQTATGHRIGPRPRKIGSAEDLAKALVEQSKAFDTTAARIILDRLKAEA